MPLWMCGYTRRDRTKNECPRQSGSDFSGRKDAGSDVAIVQACDEKMHGCQCGGVRG